MTAQIQINSKLVDHYLDQVELSNRINRERLERIGMSGLDRFDANVETWLGSLKEEIEDIQLAGWHIKTREGSARTVDFYQEFTWNGCECIILSEGWGIPWRIPSSAPATWLKFHVINSTGEFETMKLPVDQFTPGTGDYTDIARPVDEIALGHTLTEVIKEIEKVRKQQKEQTEMARANHLRSLEREFDKLESIAAIQQQLAKVSSSEPTELARWNTAVRKRTFELAEIHRKKEESERQLALEERERQRLADEAAALFRPFSVYMLTLGVKLPDENELRQVNVYVTASVPDETGWYTRISRGMLIPYYRPESPIIEITRIDIDSVDNPHAPNVCRHQELLSQELQFLSEYALATPEGL